MPLPKSTWRTIEEFDEIGSTFPTFLQVFPEEGVILNITPTHKEKARYLVWGGFYKEVGNGRVLTSLYSSSQWLEESYMLQNDCLCWTTSNGKTLEYTRASEGDIPPGTLKYRDKRRREFSEAKPPE